MTCRELANPASHGERRNIPPNDGACVRTMISVTVCPLQRTCVRPGGVCAWICAAAPVTQKAAIRQQRRTVRRVGSAYIPHAALELREALALGRVSARRRERRGCRLAELARHPASRRHWGRSRCSTRTHPRHRGLVLRCSLTAPPPRHSTCSTSLLSSSPTRSDARLVARAMATVSASTIPRQSLLRAMVSSSRRSGQALAWTSTLFWKSRCHPGLHSVSSSCDEGAPILGRHVGRAP